MPRTAHEVLDEQRSAAAADTTFLLRDLRAIADRADQVHACLVLLGQSGSPAVFHPVFGEVLTLATAARSADQGIVRLRQRLQMMGSLENILRAYATPRGESADATGAWQPPDAPGREG